jgi:hypothetical protein
MYPIIDNIYLPIILWSINSTKFLEKKKARGGGGERRRL